MQLADHELQVVSEGTVVKCQPDVLDEGAVWLDLTATYSEILIASGYNTAQNVEALAYGWMSLLDLLRPALVIADHAPGAFAQRDGGAGGRCDRVDAHHDSVAIAGDDVDDAVQA